MLLDRRRRAAATSASGRRVSQRAHVRRELVRPSPASAPIRARTSPERLVSCVWVTSRLRGKRSARSRVGRVEVVDATREKRAGSPPTSFKRQQPRVAVERGVLDALGHHRRRRLLEAGDERVPAGRLEQQHARQRGRQARLGDRLAVGVARPAPTTARRRCGRPGTTPARAPGRSPAPARRAAAARPRARTSSAPARAWPRTRSSPKRRSSPEISTHRSVSGASPAGSTNSAQTSLRNS